MKPVETRVDYFGAEKLCHLGSENAAGFALTDCNTAALTRAGPLLGAEHAGPGGGFEHPPRLTRLMGHVATR